MNPYLTTTTAVAEIKHASSLLVPNEVRITRNMNEWYALAQKYAIPYEEVALIDLNRTGVALLGNEVRVGYRARFNASLFNFYDRAWFAMPVRMMSDTNFLVAQNRLFFKDHLIGEIDTPVLDTCESSYQRGETLLNLNSRSRSNCAGCKACVHNDKTLYDDTVIKDYRLLRKRREIEEFFAEKVANGLNVAKLQQIAVVTGLFANEDDLINHLKVVNDVARSYGFDGELMYFGMQLASRRAMREFAKLSHPAYVFAVDNFTRRKKAQAQAKSNHSLKDTCELMAYAKSLGIQTTFAYIAGVDPLESIWSGVELFEPYCTRFPVVNIFQVQTRLQLSQMVPDAKQLEYYIQARRIFESYFTDNRLPRRWENYRPLWYHEYGGGIYLDAHPYG